jgi:hypothetical protein
MISDENLEVLYQKFWDMTSKLIAEEFHPLEIAGILTAQAMSIYRTVLTDEEFESMIDNISESRDRVQKLNMDFTLQ